MGLGSVMVLLCSSLTFAGSFWTERVACTLGNLCHVENVFVFLNTRYWLSGRTSFAGAVGSSSLHDRKGSSCWIKWVQELPVLGFWYVFELLVWGECCFLLL